MMWGKIREAAVVLLLPIVIAVALIIPAVITRDAHQHQEAINCTILKANVAELNALNEIARELGLPAEFEIPEVPPECDEH